MLYKSKIGSGLATFLSLIVIVLGIMSILMPAWPATVIIVMVAAFILNLFATTDYWLEHGMLTIRSGLLYRKTIPVQSVRKIRETRKPISSPALSMDRIELIYNQFDSVLLSPVEKQQFIDALLRINPDIEVRMRTTRHPNAGTVTSKGLSA